MTGNFQGKQRTFFLREKEFFFLDRTFPITVVQNKSLFHCNKGTGPIYVFQMSQ